MTSLGLRARKKERTRDELAAAALALFVAQGFEGTTVEEIAAAADVSARTFFRYFPTKEDVLFPEESGEGDNRSEFVIERVRNHPPGTAPWPVLRDALLALTATYEGELPTLLLRNQVIAATPALRTRAIERRHRWEARVVEELARWSARDARSMLELRVTVAATTAALRVAVDTWLTSDGRSNLHRLIRQAFDHLAVGLDPSSDPAGGLSAPPVPTPRSKVTHGLR